MIESERKRNRGRRNQDHSDEFMSSSYKRRNQLSMDQESPHKMDSNGELLQDMDQTNELEDTDMMKDKAAKKFIDGLRKVGPFSKHILNYSYPPLLY